MSTSNIPVIEWTDAGIVIPSESDILDGVQQDIDDAFGGGTNLSLETPQGQLASSQTSAIADKNSEIAYITNQVDPQYASGRFQDAIARIYFLERNPATSTSVLVTVTGSASTVIPAGTFAQDTSGNTYAATGDITIGSGGTATGEFQNIETGPIPCPAGTLTQVYQSISGWDAITNAADGTLGQDVETRANFEFRRKNSVALNAHGSLEAIKSAVLDVDDVLDVYATENKTGSAVSVGATSYSVAAHSIYVAVVGGTDADIADAIWNKKDLGCDTNGATSVTVYDTSYTAPYPSYTITFERPSSLPILFDVSIVDDPSLPSDIEDLIVEAIIAQFNGTNGAARERIGGTIYASKYYGPVALAFTGLSIIEILIGTATATLTSVDVGIDERPTITSTDISVTLV